MDNHNSTPRTRKYRYKLKRRILGIFNYRCCSCFITDDLQFAHKDKSYLGNGRGSCSRRIEQYSNLDKFILLCKECHFNYDKKM